MSKKLSVRQKVINLLYRIDQIRAKCRHEMELSNNSFLFEVPNTDTNNVFVAQVDLRRECKHCLEPEAFTFSSWENCPKCHERLYNYLIEDGLYSNFDKKVSQPSGAKPVQSKVCPRCGATVLKFVTNS